MTAKEAINKISVMLGVAQEGETAETQVNLAEATLLDGTKVRVDGDFEVGKPLFVITEEGDVYAPEGKHETETGLVISVDADGVITAIEEKEAEEEAPEEAPAEEEAELEAETSVSLSEEVVSQVMNALNAISENISALEPRLNATEEEFHTFKNEPAGKKITNNLNEVQKTENDLAAARFNKLVEFRKQTKK